MNVDQAARMLCVGKRAVRGMTARGEPEVRREGVARRPAVSLPSVERVLSRRRRQKAGQAGRTSGKGQKGERCTRIN